MLRNGLHFYRVAEIRLVGPVLKHCLPPGDLRKRPGDGRAVPEFLKQAPEHGLDRCKDVFLRREAQLDVKLIEFAGRAVRSRVFVAEARRNLEVLVEPGDHRELLELLRRLRKRVELSVVQP